MSRPLFRDSTQADRPASFNVASYLTAAAERAPSRVALVYPKGRDPRGQVVYASMTFRQLEEESDRLARGLKGIGIGRGTRVLLMVPPGVEFIALGFALFKVGAVLVLIDPGMGRANLLHCIREVEPEGLIAVSRLHVLRVIYRRPFESVKHSVTVGRRWFWGGAKLDEVRDKGGGKFSPADAGKDDPAAIVFTTGSTGVPKGVLYSHGTFDAQIRSIQSRFCIGEEDVALPAFAPFALFCLAMGTTSVLAKIDPTKAAEVDAEAIVRIIRENKVTYSFGSPAFWDRVGRYCVENRVRLPSIKKVIMAGAPVSPGIIACLKETLPADGESHTPYGATEALPVTSITGSEILKETVHATNQGAGVCVGRPLAGVDLRIIRISDEIIPEWDESWVLPPGEVGEIVVKGPVVTREYFKREKETALAKIRDGGSLWHRMGDVGYLDEQGRLWFCGRKSHRVVTDKGTLFTVRCEAIFNQHPDVSRSALVGVGPRGRQRPVIVVEPRPGRMPSGSRARRRFTGELLDLGRRSELTRGIEEVLFHRAFPVDFRHNAKIIREELALWAQGRLR